MKIKKEHIIAAIKNLPGRIKHFVRVIYDLPHSGKYIILSVVFLLLFLVVTFPYDFLIKKKIYALEGKSFRSIEMSGFDFSIFSETYIDNLTIVLNNNNEVSCKNAIINLTLNPVTLFMDNKLKSDFQFDSLKYTGKDAEFLFNLNGNMDLTLDKQSGIPKDGPVKIIISDSIIKIGEISIPAGMGPLPLKIESINIQSGNIDSIMTNGTIKFNTFKLTGSDLTCDISGQIEITGNSRLDLVVNIDSESAVLNQYNDLLAPVIKNNILSLRIKGTISKPEVTLSNMEKDEN
jgi:hypothetical protein